MREGNAGCCTLNVIHSGSLFYLSLLRGLVSLTSKRPPGPRDTALGRGECWAELLWPGFAPRLHFSCPHRYLSCVCPAALRSGLATQLEESLVSCGCSLEEVMVFWKLHLHHRDSPLSSYANRIAKILPHTAKDSKVIMSQPYHTSFPVFSLSTYLLCGGHDFSAFLAYR